MGSHSTSRSTELNCRGHKELWGKSPHIWGQEISEMRCFVRNKGDTQKRNIAGKNWGFPYTGRKKILFLYSAFFFFFNLSIQQIPLSVWWNKTLFWPLEIWQWAKSVMSILFCFLTHALKDKGLSAQKNSTQGPYLINEFYILAVWHVGS